MVKKRGSKKRRTVKKKAPVVRRTSKTTRTPGQIIASIVALVLIVAFVSLSVSVLQKSLYPTGVTLAPYVTEYVEIPKDYVPKLKLSDSALEINAGEMAEVLMFIGNNKDIGKDLLLDVTCEAQTTQGCAFVDLKYEHTITLTAKTVEVFPLEITTTDKTKAGVYDLFVETSMDGKTHAKEMFMLEVK